MSLRLLLTASAAAILVASPCRAQGPLPLRSPLVRADVSVTVFLSEPEEYDGGGLVIQSDRLGEPIKLPAGSAVVYGASSIHRVEPVTRGSRYAAVTWAQSFVRDERHREMLVELSELARWASSVAPRSTEAVKAARVRANLMRM